MGGIGIRTWLLVGAGFGLVAALTVLLLNGTPWAFLLEALFAVAAGAVTATLDHGAPQPTPGPGGGPPAPRNARIRSGVAAGMTVGVLAGIGLTVVSGRMIYSPSFRDQTLGLLANQGVQAGGGDSFLALVTGCVGCIYIFLLPAIAAGFGALGAWLVGLTRPAPAAPAAPTAGLPPLPPPPPGGAV